MSKKIAVITGASSGIGKQFVTTLQSYGSYDEVWVIARGLDKLKALESEVAFPIKPVALDLTLDASLESFKELLETEKPEIKLMINASGWGGFDSVMNLGYNENMNMIDLNVRALAGLTMLAVPYMSKGSQIVEIASVAAYQPIPYIATYGATKSFVLHFSRALNQELKKDGIHVMAVCPYWTKTNFFSRAEKNEKKVVKKYVCMYQPENIVSQTYKDLRKGKDVSIYGIISKAQIVATKLLPHSLVMKIWLNQQDLG